MRRRLIDSCITQLKAQGPCRTCNASKEEDGVRRGEEEVGLCERRWDRDAEAGMQGVRRG